MKDKTFAGGRGRKAPYKTSIVRVPEPLVPAVKKIIQEYRRDISESPVVNDALVTGILIKSFAELGNDDRLIKTAKAILQKKGTRKAALSKLLQVMLDRRVTQKELE